MRPKGAINSDVSFSVITYRTHTRYNKVVLKSSLMQTLSKSGLWASIKTVLSGKLITQPCFPIFWCPWMFDNVLGSLPTDQEVLRELSPGKRQAVGLPNG